MDNIDADVRMKFYNDRIKKLQNAVLQMEVDIKSSEGQLESLKALKTRAEQELADTRKEIIRVKAELEEAKVGKDGTTTKN